MKLSAVIILSIVFSFAAFSQNSALEKLLSDSTMLNGSVSFCLMESDSHIILEKINPELSLIPGSVLKLVTTSAALELLGPAHTFKTLVGYTGNLNRRTGVLDGDIIIKGGGDPVLGSNNFKEHYDDFFRIWSEAVSSAGIKRVRGRVISDDSYFDYQPIPGKWLWEDAGNYYGAGAFGLSVFDNTYEIHFRTSGILSSIITRIVPVECNFEFSNWLEAAGTADNGYVFAAPYSTNGWLSGTIPSGQEDFVLKASITDPPMLLAKIFAGKLDSSGIAVTGDPSTSRLNPGLINEPVNQLIATISPPLSEIIEVLNHESVNMYAEHLIKELGKVFAGSGSTEKGIGVVSEFLDSTGVNNPGIHMSDGSGLSPLDAMNARGLADLLYYMKNKGKHFEEFLNSLPDAGKEGTLKNYFRDPVFSSRIMAKSGSMTRVRSYAGYIKALSGRELIFAIMINNYNGTPRYNITLIEEVLKEIIRTY